jgi:hypothetical protein
LRIYEQLSVGELTGTAHHASKTVRGRVFPDILEGGVHMLHELLYENVATTALAEALLVGEIGFLASAELQLILFIRLILIVHICGDCRR